MTPDQIEQAARGLEVAARLEGPNRLLLLDVFAPKGDGGGLEAATRAALALHRSIAVDDELADVEETLEDALKAQDSRGIEEGCELYRALLSRRLKDILAGPDGAERLAELARRTSD